MSAATGASWSGPEDRVIPWQSGDWSLELRGDELADIRFDGAVVLRSVRAVARDRDWGTVPCVVTGEASTALTLVLDLRMQGLGADIVGRLEVTAGDALSFRFTAVVETDFERNRLGLVVLHPASVAGAPLTVVATDGAESVSAFPLAISPHQPAFDVGGLRWMSGGITSSLAFAGDVFEMEDQRNWTDASFKTYSTPLALPFPVRMSAGERVDQLLVLRSERSPSTPAEVQAGRQSDVLELVRAGRPAPSIGSSASTAPGDIPPGAPSFDALLVELDARTSNWRAALERAAAEASGIRLDVRIVARDAADVEDVLDALMPLAVLRVGVFDAVSHLSEPDVMDALQSGVAARRMSVALVGGTRAHFTELNRGSDRLPVTALAFSLTPQMHATNRYQLVESIPMQRLVAQNAVRIAAGRPVHVGPVTLRPRFNAVATSGGGPDRATDLRHGYGAELVPGATDARMASSELIAWTIASAAALAIDGVDSVSLFETWGPRGVVDVPAERAMRWLVELSGHPLLEGGDAPDGIWAVGADLPDGPVVLVANLRDTETLFTLRLDGRELDVALGPLEASRIQF